MESLPPPSQILESEGKATSTTTTITRSNEAVLACGHIAWVVVSVLLLRDIHRVQYRCYLTPVHASNRFTV